MLTATNIAVNRICMKATRFFSSLVGFGFLLFAPIWLAEAAQFTIVPSLSTNEAGSTIQLSALQDGVPPGVTNTFQWSFGGATLADGGQVSGAQSAILTISNATLTNSGV